MNRTVWRPLRGYAPSSPIRHRDGTTAGWPRKPGHMSAGLPLMPGGESANNPRSRGLEGADVEQRAEPRAWSPLPPERLARRQAQLSNVELCVDDVFYRAEPPAVMRSGT
eukprot:SAG31_NODE_1782_length_7281_cov_5.022139_4_plen_110_part_00